MSLWGRRPQLDEEERLRALHTPDRTPHEAEPASPDGDLRDLRDVQQTAGNQAVNQLLDGPPPGSDHAAHLPSDDPRAVRAQLGEGHPLDPALRGQMETAFGQSFADVRLHPDESGLANQLGARAFAVGEHIAFDSGQYRPGTLIGDALIAHEMAHVAQQQGAETVAARNDRALEQDANRSAIGAMMGQRGRASGSAAPRLRGGLSLQRCTRSQQFETPEYFGPHSRQTVEWINNGIESWDLVGDLIMGGTLLGLATSSPEETLASGSYDVEAQARALAAIPEIKRLRIIEHIQILLVMHGNDLNDQEREFWNNALEVLQRAGQVQAQQQESSD